MEKKQPSNSARIKEQNTVSQIDLSLYALASHLAECVAVLRQASIVKTASR